MKWWGPVFAMELRKILAYRVDFWATFLGQAMIQLLVARSLWQAIFASQDTASMNGFTLPMLTLYYLIVPVGTRMLTGENIGFISREIYDGSFNRYLIYPLSVFQYKAITYLTHSAFYGAQLALLYTLYHLFMKEVTFYPGNLLTGLSLFMLASITYVAMAMVVELLSLWADNIWSLMVMLRFFTNFFGGGFIPLTFFPEWSLTALKWTPFPYLVGLPVRATMGLADSKEIFQGIGLLLVWLFIFSLVLKLVWHWGQKRYTGVGI